MDREGPLPHAQGCCGDGQLAKHAGLRVRFLPGQRGSHLRGTGVPAALDELKLKCRLMSIDCDCPGNVFGARV